MRRTAALLTIGSIGAALALAGQAQAMTLGKQVDPCWLLAHTPAAPELPVITAKQARAMPRRLCSQRLPQVLTVVNDAGVPDSTLIAVEQRLAIQVNSQVHQAWPSTRYISFGPGGWVITLMPFANIPAACHHRPNAVGCHITLAPPHAFVAADVPTDQWEYMLSHEIVEMMVDPLGASPEVCDPVSWQEYTLGGVTLARFVGPRGQVLP